MNMKFAIYIVMLLVAICALFADTQAFSTNRDSHIPDPRRPGPFNPSPSTRSPILSRKRSRKTIRGKDTLEQTQSGKTFPAVKSDISIKSLIKWQHGSLHLG